MIVLPPKSPAEVLEYRFDLAALGEPITGYTLDAPDGLGIEDVEQTADTLTVWLSGGAPGSRYEFDLTVTTAHRTHKECLLITVSAQGIPWNEAYVDFVERFVSRVLGAAQGAV